MVDPITFEVIKHRLWQINDEQAIAIKTISASPIVVEGNDFNVGLFTSDGRLVTAGFGSMVHVGTMGTAIQGIIAEAGPIYGDDVLLTNDPYLGALHQNDVVVASPLDMDGERRLWIGNVVHHPDVGGIDEGSFCINARTLYQDPPRYLLKIVDRGQWSPSVERTFVTNSRLPDMVALDLRAQVASIHVAKSRLGTLIGEIGWDLVAAVIAQSLSLAAEQLDYRLRAIPDGVFTGRAYMDGDRVGSDRLVRVHVRLTKTGGHLDFNYEGTDAQVDAAVNCTEAACWAGTAVPIYAFLCGGEIDWNDALRQCMTVVAPPGSVVNARFPAPVSISTVGFRWLATVAASQAVAKMLAATPEWLDRACSSWNVSSNCINVFATTAEDRRVGALLSDHRGGGAAARSFGDGISHAGQVSSFSSNLGNVEETEWKLPMLYLFRRQLPDSGGPGRFRGGLTSVSALMPWRTEHVIYKVTNTAGTEQTNALGLWGGYPGAGSQVLVVRGAPHTRWWQTALFPADPQQWGGEVVILASKADGQLGTEDVLVFWAPGGGGYGDPLQRDIERVGEDIQLGRVSPEWARHAYGVVWDADARVADQAASQSLREALCRLRQSAATKPWPLPDRYGAEPSRRHVGDGAYVDGAGYLGCRHCGRLWQGPGTVVGYRHSAIGAAGPWRAVGFKGDPPRFVLEELSCPGCGALIEVSEVER